MQFSPRECQQPMVDMMSARARCNVFASPGTGKTSATLVTLDSLSLESDVFPVLIVAPLRVANLVWDEEVDKWARLRHLTVSKVLGKREDREAALKAKADIYTINYQNLVWLSETLKKWPFKTVVCDESTAIKNHRVHFQKRNKKWVMYVSGAAKNARALVRYAMKTDRWINLTGTPTPNGVENLWGQCWPIDFGESLGRTHSAFLDRWFRMKWGSSKEQQRYETMPGAEEEILERIKPFSASVDAYDYFDIERPVELDIKFSLPEKARELYDKMHEEAVAELMSGDTVVGANIGSTIMKCRQIASGFVRDEEDEWHHVHKAKVEALKELVSKLGDQPLLVAYYFQKDVEYIQKAFPKAVVLPSGSEQKAVQDKWNEGKIPMLLAHPQSAGHGLNLQWGGNNLCIYTPDWNAEFYEQIIERIGPTRQAQAGLDRLVYIHRLVASKTWDEIIVKRLHKKMSVTEMVKEALRL